MLLLILDQLGFDITALVAGLGIGGVAIALAVQNVLGDLFASLSIVLDKPFVVGDTINVGDMTGTVEYIGIKTTRLRSLSGEMIVFSNNDLLKSRIRNFRVMQERRIVFAVQVTYDTAQEKLERIPGMLRAAVENRKQTRFDRAHFKGFSESALDFEVVYFVTTPDYNVYMDVQQAINLEIYRRFVEEKIEFAYPTRTLIVHGADAPTPAVEGSR
jgi:MscS family membrane protein